MTSRLWKPKNSPGVVDLSKYFVHAAICPRGGRMIFTSGVSARDPETGEVLYVGDVVSQSRFAFEALRRVLEVSNSSLENVVKLTHVFKDVGDMAAVRQVRLEIFPDVHPPCTSFEGNLAHPDLLFEVDAVALAYEE